MSFEFVYTPDDFLESARTLHPLDRRSNRARLLLFVILTGISVFAILQILYSRPASGDTDPFTTKTIAILPWMLIGCACLGALIRWTRPQSNVFDSHPFLRDPHKLIVAEEGIHVLSPMIDSLYRWHFFNDWTETKNLLLLKMPKDLRLIIPKRAITSAEDLETLRQTLHGYIHTPAKGFPVLPPASE
jgi:YcxB-like protein